jgi:hypothetical protein
MDELRPEETDLTEEQLAAVFGGSEEEVEQCPEEAPAEIEAVVM